MSQSNSPVESELNVQSIVLDKLLDDPQMKEVIVMEVILLCFSKRKI